MKKISCVIIAAVLFFMTTHSQAATSVKILRQPGQISNMPLLYLTIDKFKSKAQAQGHNIEIVLQPIGTVSDGVFSMLAGNTDVIMGAVMPMLLANEKNPGKLMLLSGSMSQSHSIVCNSDAIKTVEQLPRARHIAMKTLGSTEHFLLQQLAKIATGDHKALDHKIVVLPRNQIPAALKNQDVDCAIPGSPLDALLAKNKQANMLDLKKYKLVPASAHGLFTTKQWAGQNKILVKILIDSLNEAIEEININPTPALLKFKSMDNSPDSVEDLIFTMEASNQHHSTELTNILNTVSLMNEMGMIKNINVPLQ
jgi:ABC-type nitrate/sulfonate/bicarbonate transport system substrate-binding protein